MKNFTEYMMDFYGPKGIYSHLNFNEVQIELATKVYISRLKSEKEFYGDTVDRENVRDIILEAREKTLPEFTNN